MEGIGAVELVMAASAMYAGTVAIAHHDEMTHSITNAMDEIFQRRTNGRKNIESIEANSGLTADSTDFYPSGFNPKPPKIKCGFWCKLLGIGGSGVVACVSVFDDECINAVSNPHSEKPPTSTPTLTLTPTATSTGTPSCPPFKQCSTQTSTSTPTNTSTPAPTPSPAYSSPYQNSPWYSHPGVDEE